MLSTNRPLLSIPENTEVSIFSKESYTHFVLYIPKSIPPKRNRIFHRENNKILGVLIFLTILLVILIYLIIRYQ